MLADLLGARLVELLALLDQLRVAVQLQGVDFDEALEAALEHRVQVGDGPPRVGQALAALDPALDFAWTSPGW